MPRRLFSVRLRASERLIVAYFLYVNLLGPFFITDWWRGWLMVLGAIGVFALVSRSQNRLVMMLRDWLPLAATIVAFKQMNWFGRATDHHLENAWVQWDRWLLPHVSSMFEASGAFLPGFFELCYVLVYAVAPVSIALLMIQGKRENLNRFWLAYLAGTLSVYALFPFFPSQPPRILFPTENLPHVITALRRFNLFILGRYSIHASVFPSAHVSSAFSAAWGLLYTIPKRPIFGWTMAFYGVCVSIATVYGRYHYAADALAGFAMSMVALALCLRFRERS